MEGEEEDKVIIIVEYKYYNNLKLRITHSLLDDYYYYAT